MTFNPELLVLARQANELSQSELAEILAISQAKLSKIEHGLVLPDDALILRLAECLDFPSSFFSQPDRVYGLPAAFHRKRKKLSARSLDRIHAEVNLARIQLQRLLQPLDLERGKGIPSFDPDEFGSPEDIARLVRNQWRVPRGPIRNLIDTVEDAGAIVILYDFGARDIDGIGVSDTHTLPLFFLNGTKPVDRQRFTLAHELGHMVMHAMPREDMEAEADRFAAEFLMPESDIRHQLGRVSLERLASLKGLWRVSMAALLRRYFTLGLINASTYKYWSIQMGKLGYRVREPLELDIAPERPSFLVEVFQTYADELRYTPREISRAVHTSVARLERMFPLRPDGLRLIAG
jgi:Zn-dependent peptidase ImmA (M78 family)/DNA-binding XRE family transcriptional regulator